MEIHVVQPGDTIYSIANRYGVTFLELVQNNGLEYPYSLVTGQTIVIVYPKLTYTVQEEDTLINIANAHNVSLMQLLKNNPFLSDRNYLYPGETVVISYNTKGAITTHGFAYPFIKNEILLKTLPNLTYLHIFNYSALEKGEIISFYDDSEIINTSKKDGTIPLLMITTLSAYGETDIETAFRILSNEEYQDQHINNILKIMKDKRYYGLTMIFAHINIANQVLYKNFARKVSNRLKQEGFLYFVIIDPTIEYKDNSASFEKINYKGIRQVVNNIIFLQYVWGSNFGSPAPVSNLSSIKTFIDYAVSSVSPRKIVIGAPLISYDWQLPYIPGKSVASSLTLDSAITLAKESGAIIQFDNSSQTPFFLYNQVTIAGSFEHIVWFLDARSINAFVKLIEDYDPNGYFLWGLWNIIPNCG